RRIPGCAVAGRLFGPGGDVPSLHDLADEAVALQPRAMGACQIGPANRDDAPILQGLQDFERGRELRGVIRHGVSLRTDISLICCIKISFLCCMKISFCCRSTSRPGRWE